MKFKFIVSNVTVLCLATGILASDRSLFAVLAMGVVITSGIVNLVYAAQYQSDERPNRNRS